MEQVILLILYIVMIYLFVGVIFAFFFYVKGMTKLDEGAKGSSIGFKLIVFPGIVVFWPFLLSKWIKAN